MCETLHDSKQAFTANQRCIEQFQAANDEDINMDNWRKSTAAGSLVRKWHKENDTQLSELHIKQIPSADLRNKDRGEHLIKISRVCSRVSRHADYWTDRTIIQSDGKCWPENLLSLVHKIGGSDWRLRQAWPHGIHEVITSFPELIL